MSRRAEMRRAARAAAKRPKTVSLAEVAEIFGPGLGLDYLPDEAVFESDEDRAEAERMLAEGWRVKRVNPDGSVTFGGGPGWIEYGTFDDEGDDEE